MENTDRIVPLDPIAYYCTPNPVPGLPVVSNPQGIAIRNLVQAFAKLVVAIRCNEQMGNPLKSLEFTSTNRYMLRTEEFKSFDCRLKELNSISQEIEDSRIQLLQSGFDVRDEWLEVPVWVLCSRSSVIEANEIGSSGPTTPGTSRPVRWMHRVGVWGIDIDRIDKVLQSLKGTLFRLAAMEQTTSDHSLYLDLVVDSKLRRVGRVGHEVQIHFLRSDAAWPIFEAILESADAGILPTVAARFHPSDAPTRETVRAVITQLRQKLTALGVTISNAKKGEKWKLIDDSAP